MAKSIKNYSSTIAANQSIHKITTSLAEAGAKTVSTEYDDNRKVCALYFELMTSGGVKPFRLPVRTVQVMEAMQKDLRVRIDAAQAERTAWKNLAEMVELMLLNIRLGTVQAEEVFMPYLFDRTLGLTLFEHMQQTQFALPAPK